MRKILILFLLNLGASGYLYGAHCAEYEALIQEADKNHSWAPARAALQQLDRQNPEHPCLDYAWGLYFEYQDQLERALGHFVAAMARNPDYYGAYMETGWIYQALRKYEAAHQYYEAAIRTARRANDASGEAWTKGRLAVLYIQYGNPDHALKHLSDALKLSETAGRPDIAAWILIRTAEALTDLGELDEAERKCRQALEIRKAAHHPRLWAAYEMLGNIHMAAGDQAGDADRALGEYAQAVEDYAQAIAMAEEPRVQQGLRTSLADAYLRTGDQETARAYYESFLRAAPKQDSGLRDSRIRAMGYLGEIYRKRRDYAQALAWLEQAAALAKADENTRSRMMWLKQIGDVYAELGDLDRARIYYDEVLKAVNDGFLELGSTPGQERYVFFEDEFAVYEAMVDLLLKKGRPEEALDYVERAKAQSVLQTLFESRIVEKLTQGSARDPLLAELAGLKADSDRKHREKLALIARMRSAGPDQSKRLQNEIESLEAEIGNLYGQMVNRIRGKLRNHPPSNSAERIRKEALKENEALVEYLVSDEKTFVFVITPEALSHAVLPIGRKGYRINRSGQAETFKSLRQLMRNVSPCLFDSEPLNCSSVDAISANIQLHALHELYRAIIQPVESRLRPGGQLIIVPDDVLYYLPFDMLVTGFKPHARPDYLLSRYPISYAYSAGLLLERPSPSSPAESRSLVMGNPSFRRSAGATDDGAGRLRASRFWGGEPLPQLPYAEAEVQRISRWLRSETLTGPRATEAAFKRKAPAAAVIHLATHAFFDRRNYLDSDILFTLDDAINQPEGEDGVLYLHEIMGLKLNARLVVLTGCETGLGRLRRGGGLEGLSRAFLVAGVPSVVGTLWPVTDNQATARWVSAFYRYLAEGRNKREALQKAKLDLIAENPRLDPFFWAAPILIGDARPMAIAGDRRWPLLLMLLGSIPLLWFLRSRTRPRAHR